MEVQELANLKYPYDTADMASRVRILANREAFIQGYNARKKEEVDINERKEFAARAMAALLSKYNMNTPQDQDTVCALAVEMAETLQFHLNRIK